MLLFIIQIMIKVGNVCIQLFQSVNRNKNSIFCITCQKTMSCTYQDTGDVKQHIGENAHKRKVKARKENRKLNYLKKTSSISDVQIRDKVLSISFVVQHNTYFFNC